MTPAELEEASWFDLSEFYERLYGPRIQVGARPRTAEAYRSTLSWWKRATPDPPLRKITTETVTRFLERLRNPELPLELETTGEVQRMLPFAADRQQVPKKPREGLGPPTVNKHRTHVLAMLDKAGPPSPRNRNAFGIIDQVIWAARYPEDDPNPRHIDPEVLDRIYRGCTRARFPKLPMICPCDWWRALMFFGYSTGFRRQALFGLRWEHVNLKKLEVRLPPELDKKRKWRIKPLHPVNARLLMRIRTGAPEVFPWPHARNTGYQHFHAIQRSAGIPQGAWYNFHDLKRACGQALQVISELVRDYMLDHGSKSTAKYYVAMEGPCRDAIQKMPLWPAIVEEFGGMEESA